MERTNELRQEQRTGHWNLMRFRSDTYDAQQAVEQTAFAEGELSVKTKELLALGIAVQTGSEAMIQQYAKRAAGSGASFRESVEAVEVAIALGGAQAAAAARFAFYSLDQLYSQEILKL
ncbi:MAG: carboxymuconolactone decarboxylase family protein [Gammaproteobacteria bacterium]|jgi:alkylhydroperoxidase/carboxymuconolactone decarboxylase family protein YurZ|nr:carboxymuconolactone decarboxylase family protein [Gammaproteobacteria bacterium]MDP6616236.1 carboxymuconolactone decarboxylase family protein [Gammaproteobacteria bacterium]MDP6695996.1 carboxymuconolactone decarboxylase family protein [Gammaproteobacteria bacterium]